jgi:arachidonate 15-lipoxygenase
LHFCPCSPLLRSFGQTEPIHDLRRCALDDPASSIRNYPYRGDACLVCDAIDAFVSEFLAIYHDDEGRVTGDWALQAWLRELRDKRVAGIPNVGSIAALRRYMVQLIFTSSAYQAAVNFTQYDVMGFFPKMPGASYADLAGARR